MSERSVELRDMPRLPEERTVGAQVTTPSRTKPLQTQQSSSAARPVRLMSVPSGIGAAGGQPEHQQLPAQAGGEQDRAQQKDGAAQGRFDPEAGKAEAQSGINAAKAQRPAAKRKKQPGRPQRSPARIGIGGRREQQRPQQQPEKHRGHPAARMPARGCQRYHRRTPDHPSPHAGGLHPHS